MTYFKLFILGLAAFSLTTKSFAGSANSITCTAAIASDAESKDIKNAPAIALPKKPNQVGGNNFLDDIKRGADTYHVNVSVQQVVDDGEKVLINYTIQKRHSRRPSEVQISGQAGFSQGLKVYYGESDFLLSCE